MPQTRVIVTGDRKWDCRDLAFAIIAKLHYLYGGSLVIVHGAAKGVDSAFAARCRAWSITQEPHPANWSRFNNHAGPKRNQEMVDKGAQLCIAVHRNLKESRGTRDCVRRCLKADVPVYLIDSDDAEPQQITEA